MPHGILWAIPTEKFRAHCRLEGEVEEHCHHLTLGMGNMSFRWLEAIDFEFEARVLHEAWDRKRGVQALTLELPKGLFSLVNTTKEQEELGGYIPHITLFTQKEVKPSASNHMLAEEHEKGYSLLETIKFRVEFCPDEQIAEAAKTSFRKKT